MEILETVWREFDGKMKIEKSVFFDRNREMAVSLAENEMVDKLDERLEFQVLIYVEIFIYRRISRKKIFPAKLCINKCI
jgi:hypothetical protein